MQTSQRLVDESDTLIRCREEELVVIAVQVAVEVGELGRRQIGLFVRDGVDRLRWFGCFVGAVVVVFVFHVHHLFQAAQEGFQLGGARLVGAEEVAPVFVCFLLLDPLFVRVRVGHRRGVGHVWSSLHEGKGDCSKKLEAGRCCQPVTVDALGGSGQRLLASLPFTRENYSSTRSS
jgi:hypothetical protein